jgi:LysM repeat protein
MNNPSPLAPQGILLEQKNKGRTRVKVAVFVVLAVHGIGLLALLMQGCKKDNDAGNTAAADQTNAMTNAAAPAFEPTNAPPLDSNPPPVITANTNPVPVTPETNPAATDYKIQAGDNLSTLARKFHVSIRALMDANPGIQPTKLQIGQTIHIPAGVASATPTATTPPSVDTGSGEAVYTVKSGDTLSAIAHENHVTVHALEAANNLRTTSIKVGQKLKIPGKVAATAAPATDNTSAATSAPPAAPGQ